MKVLFLFNSYEDDGPGVLMFELIKQIRRQTEIKCHTAAVSRGGDLLEEYTRMDIPTTVFGMKGYTDVLFEWRFFRFLRQRHFDAILTNLIRADILGRYTAKLAGIPVILTTEHGIHTWATKGKIIEKLVERLYVNSSRYTYKTITVSEFVRRDLIGKGVNEDKIVTIYNGIDTERFKPLPPPERDMIRACLSKEEIGRLVGVVGNLIEMKGYNYFMDAIPMILKNIEDAFFLFVGEGPLRPQLEENIAKEGFGSRVRFVGKISAATPKIIAAMDVLVQPSLIEAFGLSVVEAMACEIPVVVSGVGGLAEVVEDGRTGFIVPPRDPGAIADKVTLLLEDPETARTMGKEGRKTVIQKFHIDTTAEEYIRLFRQAFREKQIS